MGHGKDQAFFMPPLTSLKKEVLLGGCPFQRAATEKNHLPTTAWAFSLWDASTRTLLIGAPSSKHAWAAEKRRHCLEEVEMTALRQGVLATPVADQQVRWRGRQTFDLI